MKKNKDKQLYICSHADKTQFCKQCLHNVEHEVMDIGDKKCSDTGFFCHMLGKECKCIKIKS